MKHTRVDDAYDILKAEILDTRLPPGIQVPEPEIAARLQMSRTPVREALVRLQNEGLIELIPRRGIRVLPISPNDMRDIYQILTALEPEAAANVAENGISADQIAELERCTSEMEQALREDNLDDWANADDRFHRTLLGLNTNRRLTAYLNTLFDQAHRARVVTLRLREKPVKSTQEHRHILKSIVSGNAETTRRIFRAHRERAADELLSVLEKFRMAQL